VRPCADSTAAVNFFVVAFFLFGVGQLPFWCGGEGGPNYLMQADPTPPYQSDNKLSKNQCIMSNAGGHNRFT
jgi:hypothetical protein